MCLLTPARRDLEINQVIECVTLLHSIYQWYREFYLALTKQKFRNRIILYWRILSAVENLEIRILWVQKMCRKGKKYAIFSTLTRIVAEMFFLHKLNVAENK